jgi:hypothetical protein
LRASSRIGQALKSCGFLLRVGRFWLFLLRLIGRLTRGRPEPRHPFIKDWKAACDRAARREAGWYQR